MASNTPRPPGQPQSELGGRVDEKIDRQGKRVEQRLEQSPPLQGLAVGGQHDGEVEIGEAAERGG
jgi:hypothetical protein